MKDDIDDKNYKEILLVILVVGATRRKNNSVEMKQVRLPSIPSYILVTAIGGGGGPGFSF